MPQCARREYKQHRPEETALFPLVRDNAASEDRERLVRYCARAPLSLERLSVSRCGKVVYQLRHPIGKKTHRVMEPYQFLARLCALIPPPRHPLIRFHGVLAPNSSWRKEVVPLAQPVASDKADEPQESPSSPPNEIRGHIRLSH